MIQTVTFDKAWGDDLDVVNKARASLDRKDAEMNDANIKRTRSLLKNRHTSPFEHSGMTVFVDTSVAIAAQWMRHRTLSYSQLSQRYTKRGDAEYYVPPASHVRRQVGKPGAYSFEDAPELVEPAQGLMTMVYGVCQEAYLKLCDMGVAKELARFVLPQGVDTRFYATGSLKNWLDFLALRAHPEAQLEIRELAYQVEAFVKDRFPVTHLWWEQANNRGAVPEKVTEWLEERMIQ